MYWNLLLLAVIVIFVVDISGIVHTLKAALGRWIGGKVERLRPFDCSLCMVWWCSLVYLLVVGRFSMGSVAFVTLLAVCSVQIGGLLQTVRALLQWVVDAVLDALDRK